MPKTSAKSIFLFMTTNFLSLISKARENGAVCVQAQAKLSLDILALKAAQTGPSVLIVKERDSLLDHVENLKFLNQKQNVKISVHPIDERSVLHKSPSDPLIAMEKCSARFQLLTDEVPALSVMSAESLLERFLSAKDYQKHALFLVPKDQIKRDFLIEKLALLGYTRVPSVIDRGTFSVRGSIIDVFVNGEKRPTRIDLFGDQIDNILFFDEDSQRSLEKIDYISIGPVKDIYFDDDTKALALAKLTELADHLNYPTKALNEKLEDIHNGISFYGIEKLLPAFFEHRQGLLEVLQKQSCGKALPLLIFEDQEAIIQRLEQIASDHEALYQEAMLKGELIFPPKDYFVGLDDIKKVIETFPKINMLSVGEKADFFLASKDSSDLRADILKESLSTRDEESHLLLPLVKKIRALHSQKRTVIITVSSITHQKELQNLVQALGLNIHSLKDFDPLSYNKNELWQNHVQAYCLISKHSLANGADLDFLDLTLISENDIFGKRSKRQGKSGKQKGFNTALSELSVDDLVVHIDHGVGQFKGLVRMSMRGVESDYILIKYANDEKLYLPVHRINMIREHGGQKDGSARLDKLGASSWQTKKRAVQEAVMAMAQDLLKIYAKREMSERPPFLAPDAHYYEFESQFEFDPTEDQQKAIDDVLRDMQKKEPMDRLICGDVGYGKTEVAMRASMLAVLSKKQVAVLAPTTVLAQQHGISFLERFKNFGLSIAVISRFQKSSEIKKTLELIKTNRVDIVIGTHRLLSSDVEFADLGLLVIDEEQRFGIKAKEHFKKMRTKVDILTLSATPIPRTLQMSYFGIRNLSVIETAPVDRRAIQTHIAQFDDELIKEAIEREIKRGGQVYFVHNRVQSIKAMADYLHNLLPHVRIGVAHGQMGETELEDVMIQFMTHKISILVCTTIIETGIDVSRANTMFINDADDFGLSQLYQLRGRIGRSKERAFAYLLIDREREHLSAIAKARLDILHKFSELGAGFKIAQHDLELRGAGDLLGRNQHGHMAAVGYDLYAELLREAVKTLRGSLAEDIPDPEVVLPVSALIPESYCPDLHERMHFYQKLASAEDNAHIEELFLSMEEIYGDPADELLALKTSSLLKIALKSLRALKMEISRSEASDSHFNVTISLSAKSMLDHEKVLKCIKEKTGLHISPQQKISQVIGITSNITSEALLFAGLAAIEKIKTELI
jgi:transcription-repair coupling factor (superfamily II helicase)